MKSVRGALPPVQAVARLAQRRDPDVSCAVFVEAEHVADDESLPLPVDRFRFRRGELQGRGQAREAHHARAGRDPPLSFAILEGDLPPAPAGVLDARRQVGADGLEPFPVEDVHVPIADRRDGVEPPVRRLGYRLGAGIDHPVPFAEGGQPPPRQAHRAAALGPHPEVPFEVLLEGHDLAVAQTVVVRPGTERPRSPLRFRYQQADAPAPVAGPDGPVPRRQEVRDAAFSQAFGLRPGAVDDRTPRRGVADEPQDVPVIDGPDRSRAVHDHVAKIVRPGPVAGGELHPPAVRAAHLEAPRACHPHPARGVLHDAVDRALRPEDGGFPDAAPLRGALDFIQSPLGSDPEGSGRAFVEDAEAPAGFRALPVARLEGRVAPGGPSGSHALESRPVRHPDGPRAILQQVVRSP